MVVIAVIAPEHSSCISRIFKALFQAYHKKFAFIRSTQWLQEEMKELSRIGVEYVIFSADKALPRGILFDIVIYDNRTKKCSFESIEKYAAPGMILIQNEDDDSKLQSGKAVVIGYGLGSKAKVTASSIRQGEALDFAYCLQSTLTTISKRELPIEEISVRVDVPNVNVYHALPVVTCGLLCDIITENVVKI